MPDFITRVYKNFLVLTQHNIITDIYIAYSGGLDSHVLLHVLQTINLLHPELNLKLHAIHINHSIAKEADIWQEHCQNICYNLNIPCFVSKVKALEQCQTGQSLEAVARQLRYETFANLVPPQALLLTAHHADDQAETLLLQMLRGSGPKGLASIADNIDFKFERRLLRPLLIFSREEILLYAQEQNLNWINDTSNNNIDFDRNFLRKDIIPLLKQRWLGFLQTSRRVAINCHETQCLAETLAEQDYKFTVATTKPYNTLNIEKILTLDNLRQKNLLRYFIQINELPLPSRQKIEQIQTNVLNSRYDAQPLITWQNTEIRRYRNLLYAMKPVKFFDAQKANSLNISWENLTQPLELPYECGFLKITYLANDAKILDNLPKQTLHIRWRNGQEKFRPYNKQHHYSLNKLFQMYNIPPWERNKIPLIYDDSNNLLLIAGYAKSYEWQKTFPYLSIDFLKIRN